MPCDFNIFVVNPLKSGGTINVLLIVNILTAQRYA